MKFTGPFKAEMISHSGHWRVHDVTGDAACYVYVKPRDALVGLTADEAEAFARLLADLLNSAPKETLG